MKYTITTMETPKSETRPMVFDDLFCGDMFHIKDDDEVIYIRINTIVSDYGEDICNAINILDGTAEYFKDDELVIVYKGTLQFDKALFVDRIET